MIFLIWWFYMLNGWLKLSKAKEMETEGLIRALRPFKGTGLDAVIYICTPHAFLLVNYLLAGDDLKPFHCACFTFNLQVMVINCCELIKFAFRRDRPIVALDGQLIRREIEVF